MAHLYVVATPIGNLEDASLRLKAVLGCVGLILAEDTRRTRALLSALDIPAPQVQSCHAHNERSRLGLVTDYLDRGVDVALVSDAGTPCISDPGGVVVEAVHRAGHSVISVAGPSSVAAAVAASGFDATPFHFLGFPPRKAGALDRWIREASRLPGVLVILERGARCGKLVAALAKALPDREAVVCRELTKKHEENIRGPLSELSEEPRRGEVVLVVGPGAPIEDEEAAPTGPDLKAISAALAERWGCTKREAYQRLLDLERD
jgi:16S rRNA (cytidine1402-2'-O)-methyltransferase